MTSWVSDIRPSMPSLFPALEWPLSIDFYSLVPPIILSKEKTSVTTQLPPLLNDEATNGI